MALHIKTARLYAEPSRRVRSEGADPLAELARAAARGDTDAARTLLLQVGARMISVIRRILGTGHPDIDDVAQDAVIALLDALPEFRGESSVAHFASRIAVLSALRARSRRGASWRDAAEPEAAIEEIADSIETSPLAQTLREQKRQLIRQLLGELPEVVAEALALHYVVGYTVAEIAAMLAVSPNTVWSRLRLGKQALRHRLKDDSLFSHLEETA